MQTQPAIEQPTPEQDIIAKLQETAVVLFALAHKAQTPNIKTGGISLINSLLTQIQGFSKSYNNAEVGSKLLSNCRPNTLTGQILQHQNCKALFDAFMRVCIIKAIFGQVEPVQRNGKHYIHILNQKSHIEISQEVYQFVELAVTSGYDAQQVIESGDLLKAFLTSDISRFKLSKQPPTKNKEQQGKVLCINPKAEEADKLYCLYNTTAHVILPAKNWGFRPYLDYLKIDKKK